MSGHEHHHDDRAARSVTSPQLVVMAILSLLVLAVGVLIPAN